MEALYDIRDSIRKYWKGFAVAIVIVLIAILAILFQLQLSDLKLQSQLNHEAMSNQIHSDVVAHMNKAMEGDYFSSLLGGLSTTELDELASRVSSIVGDKVTTEVLLGTEKLVVQDLTDDIQKAIEERFNSWTQSERKAFSDEIAQIVLKDVETYLGKQTVGTDSGEFADIYEIINRLQGGDQLANQNLKDIQNAQTKEIAALQAQDKTHTSEIDTLKTEVKKNADVNNNISEINNNITNINNDISTLQNIVNEIPDIENGLRTEITTKLTTLEKELTTVIENNDTLTQELISEKMNEIKEIERLLEQANKDTQAEVKNAMTILNNVKNYLENIEKVYNEQLAHMKTELDKDVPAYELDSSDPEHPVLRVTLPENTARN